VAIAESPRETDRNSGTTKKPPDWTKYWKKNIRKPRSSCTFRSMERRTSGSPPRFSRRDSHSKKSQMSDSPPRMSHSTADTPNSAGASGLGDTHPQTLERRTPKTAMPRPAAESPTPMRSIPRRGAAGSSVRRRVSTRIPSTISTSPAKTSRQLR
jgi:hypothetical protein